MKILLVGGCGFIGYNVFGNFLFNKNLKKIIIVDNLSVKVQKNLTKIYERKKSF